MSEVLNSPLLTGLVVLVGALLIGRALATALFARKRTEPMLRQVRCRSCGWAGTVGKYGGRCARCNDTALDPVRR